jgi:hypothetical protein
VTLQNSRVSGNNHHQRIIPQPTNTQLHTHPQKSSMGPEGSPTFDSLSPISQIFRGAKGSPTFVLLSFSVFPWGQRLSHVRLSSSPPPKDASAVRGQWPPAEFITSAREMSHSAGVMALAWNSKFAERPVPPRDREKPSENLKSETVSLGRFSHEVEMHDRPDPPRRETQYIHLPPEGRCMIGQTRHGTKRSTHIRPARKKTARQNVERLCSRQRDCRAGRMTDHEPHLSHTPMRPRASVGGFDFPTAGRKMRTRVEQDRVGTESGPEYSLAARLGRCTIFRRLKHPPRHDSLGLTRAQKSSPLPRQV